MLLLATRNTRMATNIRTVYFVPDKAVKDKHTRET